MTKVQRINRALALLCNVRDELKASCSPIDGLAAGRITEAEESIEAAVALLSPVVGPVVHLLTYSCGCSYPWGGGKNDYEDSFCATCRRELWEGTQGNRLQPS